MIHWHHAPIAGIHYDLRLEKEGVLKSWALRKEPPTAIGIKRLAIPVNDHPLEYGYYENDQEGVNAVRIWDTGTVEWLSEGAWIMINIDGRKLQGTFVFEPFHDKMLFSKFPKTINKLFQPLST